MSGTTILVVEDEEDILDLVSFNLTQAGYRVLSARDGLRGLDLARSEQPDLIVLDLMLPGMAGKEVCRSLRAKDATSKIPVIMLTALAGETDRVVGFEIGADDYLTKPFSPRELVLRVGAILRRTMPAESVPGIVKREGLQIDPQRHIAEIDGQPLSLTATEFKLLHQLASRPGRVFTRDNLLKSVWGYDYGGYGRTVDTHVRRLRKKMGSARELIETVRGVGYRFKE